MALHHRKFLLDEPDEKYPSSCYICHVCPKDCYLSSSPQISQSPEPKNHQMSVILIPMLCILGAALLFLSYLTIGKYHSRRGYAESMETSDLVDENHGPVLDHPIWHIRTVGLPQSTMDSISTFRYEKGEGLIETSECPVCLSEFQEDESLRLLPKCSHAFHVNCIDTWLGSHVNCPVCRAPVLIDNVGGLSLVGSGSINSVITEENRDSQLESRRDVRGGDETGMENQLANILSENGFFKNRNYRVISDLSDHRVKLDRESERGGVRRSVSMDLSGASNGLCTKKGEGCSAAEVVEKRYPDMMPNSRIFRLIKSTSSGRSLEKGPVLMKRSFSFSGKRSLRNNKRNLKAISIQELSIHNQTG